MRSCFLDEKWATLVLAACVLSGVVCVCARACVGASGGWRLV